MSLYGGPELPLHDGARGRPLRLRGLRRRGEAQRPPALQPRAERLDAPRRGRRRGLPGGPRGLLPDRPAGRRRRPGQAGAALRLLRQAAGRRARLRPRHGPLAGAHGRPVGRPAGPPLGLCGRAPGGLRHPAFRRRARGVHPRPRGRRELHGGHLPPGPALGLVDATPRRRPGRRAARARLGRLRRTRRRRRRRRRGRGRLRGAGREQRKAGRCLGPVSVDLGSGRRPPEQLLYYTTITTCYYYYYFALLLITMTITSTSAGGLQGGSDREGAPDIFKGC